jgi:hypothetical protein
MSMITKWAGLDPAIALFRRRDFTGALEALVPVVRKFTNDTVADDYAFYVQTVKERLKNG